MAPIMATSTPSRVQLDNAIRHSPYATQRPNQRKLRAEPSPTGSSSSSLQSTPQSSLRGAPLRPTFSMLEELEVEGMLGRTLSRGESTSTVPLSRSTTCTGSDFFQSCYSSVMSIHQPDADKYESPPLSRTSTATTVLEFPNGPIDPSYGVFSHSHHSLSELGSIDEDSIDEGSWVDAAHEFSEEIRPPLDMTFRAPLSYEYDSDENVDMDTTISKLPLTYHDSTDTTSYGSSESVSTGDSPTSSLGDTPRKRIWEAHPDEYVPRPKGAPPRSVPSVIEIGMQWEREQQQRGSRSKGASNAAVGRIRRIHGDAQYMN